MKTTPANPVLNLPCVIAAHHQMSPEVRAFLTTFLTELSEAAHLKAETSWRKRKGPMAAYWKAVAVYARHLRLALRL